MRSPYGYKVSESCPCCKFRRDRFFCQLLPAELRDFDAVKFVSAHPAGAILFAEQQKCRGIFLLCEGKVKLSCGSSDGRTLVLRIAGAGEVLGLQPALSGDAYEATAEALEPCQVAFAPILDFQRYLREHPAVLSRVSRHLGKEYKAACEQLRMLGLGATTLKRVARFLLAWSADQGSSRDGIPFALPLTQEEIAESVGTTRESVARALTALGKRGLIERRGATFVIHDRAGLQEGRVRQQTSGPAGPRLVRLTPAMRRGHPSKIRPEAGRTDCLRIHR
jgi:CRP/FNR family transcriptional regulator, cyclic AMP receptor protein